MDDFLPIKLLHVLGLVYWLGGDLGVFYSSFIVSDESKAPETRVVAAKMLFALDQAPRICMTLMLPLGLHLAWRLGALPLSAEIMVGVWAAAALWLASVIYLHAASSSPLKQWVTHLDYWFRVAMIAGLLGFGLSILFTDTVSAPYWVAIKLIIFGLLIGCGLIVRIVLREFGPAFANLIQGTPDSTDNRAIKRSLSRTRPFVVCIWFGLILSAALGLHVI